MAVIFGLYPDASNPDYRVSKWARVLYAGIHRNVWALCIAWVIFACHFGYGGKEKTSGVTFDITNV